MIDAVIFDMDGLMLDTQRVWDETILSTAEKFGIELKPGFLDAVRGSSGDDIVAISEKWLGADIDIRGYLDRIWQNADAAFARHIDKKPGLDELVDWLDEHHYPMAVASGSTLEQIEHHMEMVGLGGRFDVMVSGFDVERAKPFPDVFLVTAERLGVDPTHTIVLEDSYNGLRAAHAGGFLPVMVPDVAPPTEEMRTICLAICDTLADVIPLLSSRQAFA